MKRNDYISWDEYFMAVAKLSSERSKDPNTQVGACIVNEKNRIVATGYNGAPTGFSDDEDMKWDRNGTMTDTKYAYVCHSELNAILNATTKLDNTRIYVTLFPCNECAKAIIQAGIKEVVYLEDKYKDTEGTKISKKMLLTCGVTLREYKGQNKVITINI